MCHGLFIELIADIKKPTVRVGFFLGFLAREYSKRAYNHLI
ncbi:hypothetical protein AD44_0381 [Escherichia coli 3-373-03_S4_C3]|nr:hypothetical protein AD17_0215 [Escherichia coli 3-373-03_S4_C2]KDU53619.1 hypothetical protein AC89_1554 [Escherichia coli 3-373-03_S4_C1]KEL28897.1 hypothetical protein AD44_0381 [Escherichia coli 3-373-03_S4_C3]